MPTPPVQSPFQTALLLLSRSQTGRLRLAFRLLAVAAIVVLVLGLEPFVQAQSTPSIQIVGLPISGELDEHQDYDFQVWARNLNEDAEYILNIKALPRDVIGFRDEPDPDSKEPPPPIEERTHGEDCGIWLKGSERYNSRQWIDWEVTLRACSTGMAELTADLLRRSEVFDDIYVIDASDTYDPTVVLALPPKPENLRTQTRTSTSVTVEWDDIEGVDEYRVYRTTGPSFTLERHGETEATEYEVTGLSPGAFYQFTVRAYGDGTEYQADWGEHSARHGEETLDPPPTPSPPTITGGDSSKNHPENNTATIETYTATDADGDGVSWSLSGTDSARFRVVQNRDGDGELAFRSAPNYEAPTDSGQNNIYNLTVVATDDSPSALSSTRSVEVTVTDVDEDGTVSLSTTSPEVDTPIAATLDDPDRNVRNQAWQWQSSSGGTNWSDIGSATGDTYTPVNGDVGLRLRATVTYDDVHGTGKSARSAGTSSTLEAVLPSLPAPVELRIIPHSQGRAVLEWSAPTDADGFTIEVRAIERDSQGEWIRDDNAWQTPSAGHPGRLDDNTSANSHMLILTALLFNEQSQDVEGLLQSDAYEFRVIATDSTGRMKPSAPSKEIGLVENLIVSLNGDSSGSTGTGGEILARWKLFSTDASKHTINMRKLPQYRDDSYPTQPLDHSSIGWQPLGSNAYSDWEHIHLSPSEVMRVSATAPATIDGFGISQWRQFQIESTSFTTRLQQNQLYAIYMSQVFDSTEYYSSRESYVWTSIGPAGFDAVERVATYPLSYFPLNQRYTYRMCEDTFPTGTYQSNGQDITSSWREMIETGINMWSIATAGLITTTFQRDSNDHDKDGNTRESLACPDYDLIAAEVLEEMQMNPHITVEMVKSFIETSDRFASILETGMKLNEVIVANTLDGVYSDLSASLLPEISKHLGFAYCAFDPDSNGCAIDSPPDERGIVRSRDIFITQKNFARVDDGEDTAYLEKDFDIRLDDCIFESNVDPDTVYQSANFTGFIVHEAGHVLGINASKGTLIPHSSVLMTPPYMLSLAAINGSLHHPTLQDSIVDGITVVGYSGESMNQTLARCFPSAFDILAMQALYQTQ